MKKPSKIAAGLNPQYIIDEKGKRTAVILDIKTFDRLVENLEGLYMGMGFMGAEKTQPAKTEAEYQMADRQEEVDSIAF
jgi:hypothetical protein